MPKTGSEYNETLLKHYRQPQNQGILADFSHEQEMQNSICGDEIVVRLKLEAGKINNLKYQLRGCALLTASASLLSEAVKGQSKTDIQYLKLRDIEKLLGAKIAKSRQSCVLLPLEAIQKALNQK